MLYIFCALVLAGIGWATYGVPGAFAGVVVGCVAAALITVGGYGYKSRR